MMAKRVDPRILPTRERCTMSLIIIPGGMVVITVSIRLDRTSLMGCLMRRMERIS